MCLWKIRQRGGRKQLYAAAAFSAFLQEQEGREGKHMAEVRLNKYLSEMGICSRREADRLIEAGKVLVDGQPAVMGQKVSEGQEILCDGCPAGREAAVSEPEAGAGDTSHPCPGQKIPVSGSRPPKILLAVNKPRGIVCTTSDKDRAENIVEFLNYPERIYPIGRLDKESEGLVLVTNQGELVNKIMRAANFHEKEYVVRVNKNISPEFLKRMSAGVPILNTVTRPCKVEKLGRDCFKIILTQGLNRQIRRMCQELGYKVLELKRIRIMNIELGNLKTGDYRAVTPEEERQLKILLAESGSVPSAFPDSKAGRKDEYG